MVYAGDKVRYDHLQIGFGPNLSVLSSLMPQSGFFVHDNTDTQVWPHLNKPPDICHTLHQCLCTAGCYGNIIFLFPTFSVSSALK